MTDMGKILRSDVRVRLDAHLDAVDRVLMSAGMPRSERQNITEDLGGQILEMLTARSGGSPTRADIEAVLAELDPPEAYADGQQAASAPAPPPPAPHVLTAATIRPRFSRLAIIGAVLVVMVILPLGRRMFLFPWFLVIPVATTILGLISIIQIRHSGGQLYGLGLAVFDALLFPLLLLDVTIIGSLLSGFAAIGNVEIPLMVVTSVPIVVVVDWLLIRWVWHRVKRPITSSSGA